MKTSQILKHLSVMDEYKKENPFITGDEDFNNKYSELEEMLKARK